jgi:putative ABC transport system ATP-binding protein
MSFIEVNNLVKTYHMGDVKINACDGINFKIESGELVVIVGASGAGKTTLLNILGGMDIATSGSIIIDQNEITKYNTKQLVNYRRNDIGFVFQFYNLIQNLTAKENVELATQIVKGALDTETVLNQVGLSARSDYFPSQLSGGEQQRVAIARALAKNPKLLLCDEPTGALDYVTGKQILKLLQELSVQSNKCVVLITHNNAISAMANRVIRLKSGRVDSITINDNPLSIDDIEW